MKKASSLAAAAVIVGLGSIASAGVLVNETFSTDGPIAGYVGAGKAFATGVGVTPMTVSGGKLGFGYVANIGTDGEGSLASSLGSGSALVSMKIDLTPTSYSAGQFRIVAGTEWDLGWTRWDPAQRTFAEVFVSENGISVQGRPAVPFGMSQTHTVTLFLNDSGASQSYTGPDGATYTLSDQTWSIFDGVTPLAQNVARNGVAELTYIGVLATRNYAGGQTLTDIDNLVVRDDLTMYPVPEPTSIAVLALGGMAILHRRRTR